MFNGTLGGVGGGGTATNVPTATAANNGQVISVNAAGDYVLTTPSATTAIDPSTFPVITVEEGSADFLLMQDADNPNTITRILFNDAQSAGALP